MENLNNPSPNSLKRKPEGPEDDLNDLKRPIGEVEPTETSTKENQSLENEGEKINEKPETVIEEKCEEKVEKKSEDCENALKNKEIHVDSAENIDENKIQAEDTLKDVDGIKDSENIKVQNGENNEVENKNCEEAEKKSEEISGGGDEAKGVEGGNEAVKNSQEC